MIVCIENSRIVMPVYHRQFIYRHHLIAELIGESTHTMAEFLLCPFLIQMVQKIRGNGLPGIANAGILYCQARLSFIHVT